jgi:predicted dehydrogenase
MEWTGQQTWRRRQFLKRAAAAVGGIVAAPYMITSTALGGEGRPPASQRIVMGAIGVGGRGSSDLKALLAQPDAQVVAVCDVQAYRREAATASVNRNYGSQGCAAYIDLRELLGRPDIDGVLIATGDNWHSLASILAAKAGKDMYCEKPVSVTIAESRAVAETMRRYGRIFQGGMQRRNVGQFRFAVDLARSGKLGKLRLMVAERARGFIRINRDELPAQPQPPREVMAWDLWLGPAPWRAYNSTIPTRQFWGAHLDFAGGSITEWGSHTVDLCQWANDADTTTPVRYEPAPPGSADVNAWYANGVKLEIRIGLRFGSCPVRFEGDAGYVEVGDSGQMEVRPASLLAERKFKGGFPADDHIRNFLNCVKSRAQPAANADAAHHSITAAHVANICRILGRPLKWDPAREEFIGDDQANRMRSRAYRQPWHV